MNNNVIPELDADWEDLSDDDLDSDDESPKRREQGTYL